MRKLALFAMLAAFVPWACAQRMASAPAHLVAPARPATRAANAPAFTGVRGNFSFGHREHPFSRFPHTGQFGPQLFPLLADWFSPDDLYAAGYPVASSLPYFVMQGGSPAPADSVEGQPQQPHESLLIELQGDRYVRVSDTPIESGVQQLTSSPDRDGPSVSSSRKRSARVASHDSAGSQAPAIVATAPAAPLLPVILVLRDGTRQEVRDYTIADGTLYASGDFYTDGYWNKKIEISTLDVPETLAANNTRGVRFVLPSAPNEVITRP